MATNYDNYVNQQTAKALKEQQNYINQRQANTSSVINDLTKQYNLQKSQELSDEANQMAAVPEVYKPVFDRNALNEMVGKRLAQENAANLGLSNSGYNDMAQTSAAVQRMNADTATNAKQQSDIDTIRKNVQDYLNKLNSTLQQNVNSANERQSADILNNYSNLMNTAKSTAASLYNTDVEAQSAAQQLAAQKAYDNAVLQQKQTQMQQDAQQAEENRKNNLFISLKTSGVPTTRAYALVYGNDAEKTKALYDQLVSEGAAPADASNQAISNVYGTSQGALIQAFRDLQ